MRSIVQNSYPREKVWRNGIDWINKQSADKFTVGCRSVIVFGIGTGGRFTIGAALGLIILPFSTAKSTP